MARQLTPLVTRLAPRIKRDHDELAKVHRHVDEVRQRQARRGGFLSRFR
jgi:hypothetical protein